MGSFAANMLDHCGHVITDDKSQLDAPQTKDHGDAQGLLVPRRETLLQLKSWHANKGELEATRYAASFPNNATNIM